MDSDFISGEQQNQLKRWEKLSGLGTTEREERKLTSSFSISLVSGSTSMSSWSRADTCAGKQKADGQLQYFKSAVLRISQYKLNDRWEKIRQFFSAVFKVYIKILLCVVKNLFCLEAPGFKRNRKSFKHGKCSQVDVPVVSMTWRQTRHDHFRYRSRFPDQTK